MARLADSVRVIANALAAADLPPHLDQAPKLTRAIQFRADKHLVDCSSFYSLEYDASGTCFRWSGPTDRMTFRLRLAPGTMWRARLRFLNMGNAHNQTETRLFINHKQIPVTLLTETGLWLLQSEHFSPSPTGSTTIVYLLAGTIVPSDMDPRSNDHRHLGIAWHDLRVEPAPPAERMR